MSGDPGPARGLIAKGITLEEQLLSRRLAGKQPTKGENAPRDYARRFFLACGGNQNTWAEFLTDTKVTETELTRWFVTQDIPEPQPEWISALPSLCEALASRSDKPSANLSARAELLLCLARPGWIRLWKNLSKSQRRLIPLAARIHLRASLCKRLDRTIRSIAPNDW